VNEFISNAIDVLKANEFGNKKGKI